VKIKFLFLAFIFNFLSVTAFPQERNVEIQISLKSETIVTKSKNVLVKIKVINKSEQILNTEELGKIFLYFSKCHKDEMCYRQGDLLFAGVEIKPKKLKQNKSVEFESNLSSLTWQDNISSFRFQKNNFKMISAENIYFYAAIPRKNVLPDGSRLPEDFQSNQIIVRFD
jgi:hypothetical protein